MRSTVSFLCPHCGREFELPANHMRKRCPDCARKDNQALKRACKQHTAAFPNFAKLVRCVRDAAEIYEPGQDYASNIVKADIKDGLVSASCFKPLTQRANAGPARSQQNA